MKDIIVAIITVITSLSIACLILTLCFLLVKLIFPNVDQIAIAIISSISYLAVVISASADKITERRR